MYYDALILSLMMTRPMHGYEIKNYLKIFNRHINGSEISNNTVYPLLSKFEKKGIATKQVVEQEGKPSKIVYAITDEGKEYFYKALNTITRSAITSREEFCMKLVFFPVITPYNRKKLLSEREAFLQTARLTDENPLYEPSILEGSFDREVVYSSLIPYYSALIDEELKLIEFYKQQLDSPCLIPEDTLPLLD
ncbi:MAG: PadR family transcriptional regulator [Coriobacteriia bacterium]|nr:PadR family transcriptional regulator [Coriobacteriia bacterium]MCL2750505.1 PadR family transcriptional regulator [Coriobacteriia bacterium]